MFDGYLRVTGGGAAFETAKPVTIWTRNAPGRGLHLTIPNDFTEEAEALAAFVCEHVAVAIEAWLQLSLDGEAKQWAVVTFPKTVRWHEEEDDSGDFFQLKISGRALALPQAFHAKYESADKPPWLAAA